MADYTLPQIARRRRRVLRGSGWAGLARGMSRAVPLLTG